MDILDYLNSNGIMVGEDRFTKEDRIRKTWNVEKQVSLIVDIQNILSGNKATIIPRIESNIGKEIESFIVQLKKSLRAVALLEEKKKKSYFDNYLIEQSNKIINRAKNSIEALDEKKYLELIMRSMKNYEICLGRVDEGNLKINENTINIRTLRYLSYNLVENDCYNYIRRLKKRGYDGSINFIIDDFVSKKNLSIESSNYIKILANYPIESIKTLLKIKYDKNRFTEEKWIEEIKLSENIDGKELF